MNARFFDGTVSGKVANILKALKAETGINRSELITHVLCRLDKDWSVCLANDTTGNTLRHLKKQLISQTSKEIIECISALSNFYRDEISQDESEKAVRNSESEKAAEIAAHVAQETEMTIPNAVSKILNALDFEVYFLLASSYLTLEQSDKQRKLIEDRLKRMLRQQVSELSNQDLLQIQNILMKASKTAG